MNFGRRGGIARSVPAAVAERSELSGSPLQSGADEARIGSFWGSMSVIGMFRQQSLPHCANSFHRLAHLPTDMAFRYMPEEKSPLSIKIGRVSKQQGATDERLFQTDAYAYVIGIARDVGDGRVECQDSSRDFDPGANHGESQQRDGECRPGISRKPRGSSRGQRQKTVP